jgi:hypothetical protein
VAGIVIAQYEQKKETKMNEQECRIAEIARKDRRAMDVDLSNLSRDELMAHYQRARDEKNSLYESRVRKELETQHNTVIWP